MPESLDARQAYMVLNALPGMGPVTLGRLLEHFGGDPVAVLQAPADRLARVPRVGAKVAAALCAWPEHFNLEREEGRLASLGAAFVTRGDADYPAALREIHDPPIGLYFMGGYRFVEKAVGIVGSRRCTLYGQSVAKRLAGELARLGFCVVSGMARGIDTAAHQGALDAGGRTAAVLGCGLDIIYPPENYDLYRALAEKGAVLSEFPFGRRADKQSFAIRNRVVAGLCDALVVVESDASGGAMITARFAADLGRPVFAVPGRIDQPSSRGCHQLIRDGATLFSGIDDLLSELDYLGGHRPGPIAQAGGEPQEPQGLAPEEAAIWECFRGGCILTVDTLGGLTGLGAGELGAALMGLELKRLVRKRVDGAFERA